MLDSTLDVIGTINRQLCRLCGLSYVDFYKAENFIILFDLQIDNCEIPTLNELMRIYSYNDFWNRITFIQYVIKLIENRNDDVNVKKVIRAINRAFSI